MAYDFELRLAELSVVAFRIEGDGRGVNSGELEFMKYVHRLRHF